MPKTKLPIITKLVRERHYCELSQVKLATKLGLLNKSVNRWEKGGEKILLTILKQIEQLPHLISHLYKAWITQFVAE